MCNSKSMCGSVPSWSTNSWGVPMVCHTWCHIHDGYHDWCRRHTIKHWTMRDIVTLIQQNTMVNTLSHLELASLLDNHGWWLAEISGLPCNHHGLTCLGLKNKNGKLCLGVQNGCHVNLTWVELEVSKHIVDIPNILVGPYHLPWMAMDLSLPLLNCKSWLI